MKMMQYALTTVDNEFNPFTDFKEWYLYDMSKGYNCAGKVARLSEREEGMGIIDCIKADNIAVDRLLALDPFGIYMKVGNEITIPD